MISWWAIYLDKDGAQKQERTSLGCTCCVIFNCLAFHLSSLQEQQQRISPSVQEIFKSVFQVTFLIVLLNKASHVAKPRFNGVEKLTPAHVQGEFQSHIAKVHGDRDRQNFYCFFFFFNSGHIIK